MPVIPGPGYGQDEHEGADAGQWQHRVPVRLHEVGPGEPQSIPDAKGRPNHKADRQRHGLRPPPNEQYAAVGDHWQKLARGVNAHQHRKPQQQPAEPGRPPGPPPDCRGGQAGPAVRGLVAEGVEDQAKPSDEQDLRKRLAVGRTAGELHGKRDRDGQRRQRCPPRPEQTGCEPSEGQYSQRAKQWPHQQRDVLTEYPHHAREQHRQPGHELQHDRVTHLVGASAITAERQGAVMGAAERRGVRRDRQRAVARDPCPELVVASRVAGETDKLGAEGDLVDEEHDHDQEHRDQGPPWRVRAPCRLTPGRGRQRVSILPGQGRDRAQPVVQQRHRARHGQDRHWHRLEKADCQQQESRNQPGSHQQRREHRQPREQQAGIVARRPGAATGSVHRQAGNHLTDGTCRSAGRPRDCIHAHP